MIVQYNVTDQTSRCAVRGRVALRPMLCLHCSTDRTRVNLLWSLAALAHHVSLPRMPHAITWPHGRPDCWTQTLELDSVDHACCCVSSLVMRCKVAAAAIYIICIDCLYIPLVSFQSRPRDCVATPADPGIRVPMCHKKATPSVDFDAYLCVDNVM